MEPQPMPSFLTVNEVADVTRVSKLTVYRLILTGDLPAIRTGCGFRVPQGAIESLPEVLGRVAIEEKASGWVGEWQA